MNYEQKYNEALEWARSIYPHTCGSEKEDLEHFFPELSESEDERIRKEIISFVLEVLSRQKDNYEDRKFDSWLAWLEKQKEQKPAEWSEEDGKNLEETLYFIREFQQSNRCKDEGDMQNSVTCENWLKSRFKSLRPQPHKEWTEEDEKNITEILCILHMASLSDETRTRLCNWIRNIHPHWKPSEEQMEALDNARFCKFYDRNELDSLYEDLKKL